MSVDGVIGGYLSAGRTHPHVATRVHHLIQWVEHGSYLRILSGHYRGRPRRVEPRGAAQAENVSVGLARVAGA
jgi:hypothetical protein